MIRTALIYVALLWAALQVADLLAEAGFISEQLVRGLILLGAVGLPFTLLGSWFLETPWKQRKWISIAGDLLIITAIGLAAALFAWQQWFTSFTRPSLAVIGIEATDLRTESDDLATHLALRLRTVLAMRPELRVIELTSSRHADLAGLSIAAKARRLGANYVLAGTVAQADSRVRLNVQLFSSNGELVHGESLEDRLLDLAQIQNRVLAELWPHLPLPENALRDIRGAVAECKYPDGRDALLTILGVDNDKDVQPAPFLEKHSQSGMLQLAQARLLFRQLRVSPPTQRPVAQRIAMQHLATAEQLCPSIPDTELLRIGNTLEPVTNEMLHKHPNSSLLLSRAAAADSHPGRSEALINAARALDPLGDW